MSEVNESLDYEDYDEMDFNADEDEDESSEEYDYTDDFCDDAHFDGFLKSNADVDADLIHDQIMNFLRLGIDSTRSASLAVELVQMATTGYKKQVAAGIVEFVCACPPSNVELVQRFQSVHAVVKIWEEFGEAVTDAINEILDIEKPALNRIPSRNLANFIRVLVDENIIDKDKILIASTRECALPDPYLERLHQVLYNHYGCGNPKTTKTTSMFGNFLSNIIPSTSTNVTTAPTPTAGNQTSTNQAQPSSSTSTATSIDASASTPPTESGDQSQSTLSTFMNTWKKMVSSSAPSSSS
jgi:hypothetical protein